MKGSFFTLLIKKRERTLSYILQHQHKPNVHYIIFFSRFEYTLLEDVLIVKRLSAPKGKAACRVSNRFCFVPFARKGHEPTFFQLWVK